jgi:hypothetical protein
MEHCRRPFPFCWGLLQIWFSEVCQIAGGLSISHLNKHACTGKCECEVHLSTRVDAKQVVAQPVSCQAQLEGAPLDQLLQVCVHLTWYQQLVTCNTMLCQTGAETYSKRAP